MSLGIEKTLNLQFAEQLVTAESPIGDRDGLNIQFVAKNKFIPDTLQVFLSGLQLEPDEDFEIYTDNQTFKIKLKPSDPVRLNVPPLQYESLRINYIKA